MSGVSVEQRLEELLSLGVRPEAMRPLPDTMWVLVLAPSGEWWAWPFPHPVLLEIGGEGTEAGRGARDDDEDADDADELTRGRDGVDGAPAPEAGDDDRLRACLTDMGLEPEAVELFAVAAATAGALAAGTDLAAVARGDAPAGCAADDEAAATETSPGDLDLRTRTTQASHVLDLVGSLTRLTAHLEGLLVGVVGDLTVRNGRVLLSRKGVTDPGELTDNQAKRWRARSKSVTRSEIEALTGWGEGEVSDLVALANAPGEVSRPVTESMQAGVTPWRLARRFLRDLGHEAHEDVADVAERLFGTDPQTVCTDRLDPDGDVKGGPWEHKLFHRALAAEATRLASRDPQAAAQARERARQKRDVRVVVNDDGTGAVTVSGTAAQVTAVGDRLERAAREARALGDQRSPAELRADLAMSLLMHAGLALPDPLPADADDQVRTAWTEQMRAVLAALPPAVLNVIVPFDALVHSPQRPLFGSAFVRPQGKPTCACGGSPPGGGRGSPPVEVLSMGEVTGAFPQFLTPDAVRELALTPGTTLHRLLVDPADGRCVERSITAYAPDAAMRAQVHAADVTCRAPGCVRHAPYTQLDHVVPHGAGGPTSETNLQALHTRHHDAKTHGSWEAVMTPDRDVTWTSLLGRIYRTRAHDYRQYSTLHRAAVDRVHREAEQALADDAAARATARAKGHPGAGLDGRGERRPHGGLTREAALADAVDRAVYRALTYRGPARPLRSGDDYPDSDTDPAFLGWETLRLTHTTATGQRRYGPDPTTAEQERDLQQAAADPDGTASAGDDSAPGARKGAGTAGAGWRHQPDDEPPPF